MSSMLPDASFRTTNAFGASPLWSSGTPITAASTTFSWSIKTSSFVAVKIRHLWRTPTISEGDTAIPFTLIRSLRRSTTRHGHPVHLDQVLEAVDHVVEALDVVEDDVSCVEPPVAVHRLLRRFWIVQVDRLPS
uniref:Uncharacterized protein n=1 Tax=Steinernema glaseri TaxID=37863 RepID=A0A1I7ZL95_9BILA